MSGKKMRHFLNNLCSQMDDTRYLEIGVWKGSTVCSAMFNNNAFIYCIDNFSTFGGPKEEFLKNFNYAIGKNNATFINNDCFSIDISLFPKFNIYFFDGHHTYEDQFKAIEYFLPCLDDCFVLIIDDWNWSSVRSGTLDSINKANLTQIYTKEIRTTFDDTHVIGGTQEDKDWHNGICIFVLKK
jgi:hypothetical protein